MNMKKIFILFCLVFFVFFTSNSFLLSQETSGDIEGDVQSEEQIESSAEEPEEKVEAGKIVVTGTKTKKSIKNVPVRTIIISKEKIQKKGAVNLYDALEGESGIRVEQQCSACNFSMVRINGSESQHTMLLIDGLPAYTGLAGVYGLQQIQSGNIEQIEIVKGGGSALYGSDAIAGVINVITKEPGYKPEFEVTSYYGSYETGLFAVTGSYRKDNVGAVVSVQKSFSGAVDQNGDKDTDEVETDNSGGLLKLCFYDPLGIMDLFSVTGKYINEFRRGGILEDNKWDNPFEEGTEHIRTTRYEIGFGLKKMFGPVSRVAVNVNYSRHKRDATNDAAQDEVLSTTAISNAGQLPVPFIADEKVSIIDVNYLLPLKAVGRHEVLTGVTYRKSVFEQKIGQIASGTRTTTPKEASDTGVYLQDEYKPVTKLTILAGLRWDFHKSEEAYLDTLKNNFEEKAISPRGAVKYDVTKEIAVRANAGTGFRVPYHFAEDLHLCSGSPRVAKPTGLKAETSVTYGGAVDFDKKISFGTITASIGYTRINIKDTITFEPAEPVYVVLGYDQQWENTGDSFSDTFDVSAGIPLLIKDVNASISYTYNKSEYKENRFETFDRDTWDDPANPDETVARARWLKYRDRGKAVSRSPKHSGNIGIDITPGTWVFNITGRWTGKMFIDHNQEDSFIGEVKETSPFWITDVRIAKTLGHLTLFAGAKNVFDYFQKDRRTDDAAFIYAPLVGKKFYGGANVKF